MEAKTIWIHPDYETESFWDENERRIRTAVMGTDEEKEALDQLQKREKLAWAEKVGTCSHRTFLKMSDEARLLQLEAEELLIQQLATHPLKKWMKLSDKEKQNHWFTKHVHEPETKEEYEALVKQAKAESRFGHLVVVFEKWLEMTPEYIDALKLSLAVVLSAKFKDDAPLWLDIVAKSGGGKTKLLKSLCEIPYTEFRSSLTPASLVSGDRRLKTDPSLLPKLKNKCLIWKDFTEVLSMKYEEKNKIYSILRGAYDGTLKKDYGTGIHRDYKDIFFSMLAGVTADTYLDDTASLGERRLKFRLPQTEMDTEEAKIEKALSTSESSGDEELQTACKEFAKGCNVEVLPPLPDTIKKRLKAFAMIVGRLRTTVNREKYDSLHRITLQPEPEEAMRLAKQLKKLGQMLAIVMDEEEVTEEIFDLILDVGFSTPHPHRIKPFQMLNSTSGKMVTKNEIQEKVKLSSSTLSRTLEDMEAIGIVKRKKGGRREKVVGGQTPDKWCLVDEIKKLWLKV